MAKNNRFPSPANAQVGPDGKPAQPKPGAAGAQPKMAEGKPAEAKPLGKLLQVHYKGENNVVFPNGVHSLAPGLNHVHEAIMEEAKKHPSIAKLIEEGRILFGDQAKAAAASGPEDADDADDGEESE